MREIALAWRRLRKSPGFAGAAALILAAGVGANTAVFSVLYAGFFTRHGLAEPERLLRIYGENPSSATTQLNLSIPRFQLLRAEQTVFTRVDAARYGGVTLLGGAAPSQVTGAFVTAGFLETFGARPLRGRFFEPAEEDGGAVAIISETLWRERFGADAEIVGRTLPVAGAPATIVGVAPRLPAVWQADVFLTGAFEPPGLTREVLQRGVSFLATVGRLRAGETPGRASAELSRIADSYRAAHPDNADAAWRLTAVGLRDDIVGASRAALFTLLGAVALVLLLACANVAGLLLLRFDARRQEIAVRAALGSSRARIVRQFVAESVLVSFVGGAAGTALAVAVLPALSRAAADFLPFAGDIQLHVPVLAASLFLSLLCGTAIGLYPALASSDGTVAAALHQGSRTVSARGTRARRLLVSGQVALSFLLVVGAALLATSFAALSAQPTGFRADGVFVGTVSLPPARYASVAEQARFFMRVAEALRAAPGVRAAALIQGLPLSGALSRAPYARADGVVPPLKDRPLGPTRSVTPGYFATLGIPLVAGRDFDEQDNAVRPAVVIVSEQAARRLFPEGGPLGRRVLMGSLGGGQEMEVVGVVGDVRSLALERSTDVEFYRPVLQRTLPFMQLAVRTAGEPSAFAATARQVLRDVDPELALVQPGTLAEVVARSVGRQRAMARLVGLFALLALVVAVAGIYSVAAHAVRQRSRDIGIRLALGARPREVVAETLSDGVRPAVLGVGTGALAAAALARAVQSQLYGVSALDPATLGAAAVTLTAVAVLACLLPARRAAAIDPAITLRSD